MQTKRQRQVAELIKRNIGTVLQQEGAYIYGAEPFVTVTSVKMTPDFGIAKIYLSVYNIEDKQSVLLHIERDHQRLQSQAWNRMRKQLRRLPELHFYLDDTLDEMYRLNAIFNQLHEDDQMGEAE